MPSTAPAIRSRLKIPLLLFLCCLGLGGFVFAANSLGKGREYGDTEEDEDLESEFSGFKQTTEEEGRQKDLGNWLKDVEILKQEQGKPLRESPDLKPRSRSPNLLNTPKPGDSTKPGFLEGQAQTERDVEEGEAFKDQAMADIERELETARGVAKAGNSIVNRGDGARFYYYHGLLYAASNQHFQNGQGLDTVVSMTNIQYDFSRRLMTGYKRTTIDPEGNASVDERSNIQYTNDSSGLPGRIQRVTGYHDRITDADNAATEVVRSNGKYEDVNNPSYNNADYAGQMITSYDETSTRFGVTTRVQFRNAAYDALGNALAFTQSVYNPNGELDVTQRTRSTYVQNPGFDEHQYRLERNKQVDVSRPAYLLTAYDQRVTRSDWPTGALVSDSIEHHLNGAYDTMDRLMSEDRYITGSGGGFLALEHFQATSYDPFGRQSTWRTTQLDYHGFWTIDERLDTEYDKTGHVTKSVERIRRSIGSAQDVVTETVYNQWGEPIQVVTTQNPSVDVEVDPLKLIAEAMQDSPIFSVAAELPPGRIGFLNFPLPF